MLATMLIGDLYPQVLRKLTKLQFFKLIERIKQAQPETELQNIKLKFENAKQAPISQLQKTLKTDRMQKRLQPL